MPRQRFTTVHRRAVFEAYGGRCFFCDVLLTYREAQLEHLIPQELLGNPTKLAGVLADYALSDTYDLQGDQNVVLSCTPCNRKKTNNLIRPAQMAVMVAAAERKVPRVQELRHKYSQIITTDKLVLSLIAAYESGTTDPQEFERLMWRYYGQSSFKLSHPLRFIGAPNVTALSRADLEDLWDTPVQIWEGTGGIELVHDDGRNQEVTTCREYSDAGKAGFYPLTTAMIKMSAIFESTIGVLYALEHAEPARISFIREPRIGLCDLRFISTAVAPAFGGACDEYPPGPEKTLQDLQGSGSLEIIDFSSLSLTFKYDGLVTLLREILRADIDHDGIEEILIFSYSRADGGTFGFGGSVVLGRKGEDGLLKPLDIPLPHHSAGTGGAG